jgi:hypothetical protein
LSGRKYIIVLPLLVGILLSSCRFGKPLITYDKTESKEYVDSLKQTNVRKGCYYISLRWGIHKGGYNVIKVYNSMNKLIEKDIYKATIANMYDGNVRSWYKDIYYDSLGRECRKDYGIRQNHGIGGSIIMDKSIVLNGTKWLKIDNRDTAHFGMEAIQNSDFNNAFNYLQVLLKKDSTSPIILMDIAHAYLFTGNYTRAIEIYKKHLDQNFNSNYTWEEIIRDDFEVLKGAGLPTKPMDKVLKELNIKINPVHVSNNRFE